MAYLRLSPLQASPPPREACRPDSTTTARRTSGTQGDCSAKPAGCVCWRRAGPRPSPYSRPPPRREMTPPPGAEGRLSGPRASHGSVEKGLWCAERSLGHASGRHLWYGPHGSAAHACLEGGCQEDMPHGEPPKSTRCDAGSLVCCCRLEGGCQEDMPYGGPPKSTHRDDGYTGPLLSHGWKVVARRTCPSRSLRSPHVNPRGLLGTGRWDHVASCRLSAGIYAWG